MSSIHIVECSYCVIDEALSDSNVGARKGRNVRDNIFVLNAITNSVVNGKEEPIDVQVFDIEKCYDALWTEECINDLYEPGFDNDKLPLLFKENQHAKIAIKTPTGTSKRVSINNIIMQGTVWGSLFCTVSMDKLGQHVYSNEELLYKYKGEVEIPSLDSVRINDVVNAFVETKKLTLSSKKCHKIHIQKKSNQQQWDFLKLKVHNEDMSESTREKYLGDIVDSTVKIRSIVKEPRNKGYGRIAEILVQPSILQYRGQYPLCNQIQSSRLQVKCQE